MMVAAMAASMAACGSDGGSSDTQKGGSSTSTSDVANKDKPLVWFNRQPSNSSTGELDTTALNYNKDTYYVGFDANQGAELQGEMVKEYIEKNIDTIDRNGMALSDMYLQSVISDTTIQLQEQEVFVKLLEQA
mgnify:CR=1 FL=1